MRRRCAVVLGLVMALAVILGLGWRFPAPRPLGPRPEVAFWEWSGRSRLDGDVESDLRSLGCRTLYAWCGSVERRDEGGFTWLQRGGVPDVPADIDLHLVVRCEASVATRLGGDLSELATIIADGIRARAGTRSIAGVQLDADVPVRLLDSYAGLLRAVRSRLPADWQVGSTMLLSWRRSDDLAAVAAAVDELVPQCYSVTGVTRDGPLVGGGDVVAVAAALERLGVAYRIGLPTIEQTAVLRNDRVLAAAAPCSLVTLLRAGLAPQPVFEPWGWGVRLDGVRAQSLGMLDVHAGDVLRVAMPTAAGLARRITEVRQQAGPRCRGVVFFRLPGPEATRTLSCAQIQAALADAVQPARLDAQVESTATGWRLRIDNPGHDDWLGWRQPAQIHVAGCRGPLQGTGAITIVTTRAGVPCAPLHGDGARIDIGLVPAGGSVSIVGSGPLPTIDSSISTRTPRLRGSSGSAR